MLRYGLYRQIWSPRKRNNNGGFIFEGAHNAVNDAVADLKVASCIVLDSIWGTDSYDSDDDADDLDGYMADVSSTDAQAVLIDRYLDKPIPFANQSSTRHLCASMLMNRDEKCRLRSLPRR